MRLRSELRVENYLSRRTDTLCYIWSTITEYRILDSVIIDPRFNGPGGPRAREKGRNPYLGWGVGVGCFLVATPARRLHRNEDRLGCWFLTPAAASRVTTSMMIHSRKDFALGGGATRLIRLRTLRHGIAAGYACRARGWLATFHWQEVPVGLSFMIITNRHAILLGPLLERHYK